MTPKYRQYVIGILLPALISSYSKPAMTATDDQCITPTNKHSATTFLLVDRSDKLTHPERLNQTFQAIADKTVKSKKGERLIIGVITGKAAETRILMDMINPENSIFEPAMKIRKKRMQFRRCLDHTKERLSQQDEAHPTSAILETLTFVSRMLMGDEAKQKRMVIHSDMVQNSEALSFYRHQINPDKALFQRLERDSLMPPFADVDVYVAGAGGAISDKQARVVQRFWEFYFKQTGARLHFYGPLLTTL